MIEAVALQKTFKGKDKQPVHAVQSVSFSSRPGRVLGLLGPNGAGKTTTLRMLSSAIAPSAGEVRVMGTALSLDQTELRRRIGFLSGHTGLYGRLTVRENIAYFGRAYGLQGAALEQRVQQLIEQFGLQAYAGNQVEKLSFGTKQRVAIARTVVHTPAILILDEPTTGLDILGAKLVSDFIRDYKAQGAGIIFSTHHMHEVEQLCDDICIITSGRSVYEGGIAGLLQQTGQATLHDAYLHTILQHQA
jgi:sodium transport system ATP-binding protein